MQSSQDRTPWREVQYKSCSLRHTRTQQLEQKITVHILWSRDLDRTGVAAPVDDIEGSNVKNNYRSDTENATDMKIIKLFMYESLY